MEDLESIRGDKEQDKFGKYMQWSSGDGKSFFPALMTKQDLPSGIYEVKMSEHNGIYFEKVPVTVAGLIRFPESNSEKVIEEIHKFWERGDVFKEYNLTHKRGILLWGPPGSGKSSTIQFVMKDVVERGGIVVKFTHPFTFKNGVRVLREIEPNKPIVVLMEDIDAIVHMFNESDVLNILDGVDQIEKAVFLATTNYPERLGSRIINRPSRFDKRFKIGYPNPESRKMYIEFLVKDKAKQKKYGVNVDQWVKDTEGFSLAHLKELFTAVVILDDKYADALETLRSMIEIKPDSLEDERPLSDDLGF